VLIEKQRGMSSGGDLKNYHENFFGGLEMKNFYKQPTLTVIKLPVENVLTLSVESEDSYFNLNWISGADNNGQEGN
jgi:hypothetical protein